MVVCKFFQQGNCRYGQNCRFEHIYGTKYSYNSQHAPAPAAPGSATDEQLIQQVQTDVQAALRGGQWLLSCYAPFKEKPAFPGIQDLSFEEARLFIYEARANNNVEQAVTHMNNLFKEARTKYEQLLLKNSNITRVLRSLFNGENVAFSFSNISQDSSSFGNNNPASSVFRSAVQTAPFVQNNQASIFSQNNAPFNQNNATPSVFSQNNTSDPARSIFAQANQNPSSFQNPNPFVTQNQNNQQMNAQPNIFQTQTNAATSIFAEANQNVYPSSAQSGNTAASLFATASQSAFNQQQTSPFSQNQAQSSNIFHTQETQSGTSGFSTTQNAFQQTYTGDMNIYSRMEDLMAEDIEAFKSSDFKMGFVPEVPPPHSLCF